MVSLSTTKKVIQKEYTENITKLKYYTRKKNLLIQMKAIKEDKRIRHKNMQKTKQKAGTYPTTSIAILNVND